MSDPFALVSPSYCLEERDVLDLVAEFGPYSGRYVYKYPKLWISFFEKHIEQLHPVEKSAIKQLIRTRLDLALFDINAEYDDSSCWDENVKSSPRFRGVQIIVGDALDPKGFKSWRQSLPMIRDVRRHSWSIGGSWSDYRQAIEPLLAKAPACYLIDRHFDPFNNESYIFLRSLLEKVKATRCFEIHFITRYEAINRKGCFGPKLSPKDVEIEINRLLLPIVPQGRKLIFHFVTEDKQGGEHLRMHNRFFLTKHGAIDFGIGFDLIDQKHKQIKVYVVGKSDHDDMKKIYIDGVCRFCEKLPRMKSLPYPRWVDKVTLIGG